MASGGEDFTFTGDEHHHHHRCPHSSHHPHHHSLDPHRFTLKPHASPPPPPSLESPPHPGATTSGINEDDGEHNYRDARPQPFHPFSLEEDPDPDPDHDPDPFTGDDDDGTDPKRTNSRSDKRKDHEELSSDGGTPFYYKKPKPPPPGGVGNSEEGGEYRVEFRPDYRKDREEWSDSAIGSLLDAYTEKYHQLNRGNLRNRDWEDVASVVSARCDKQKGNKTVEQCKNKVDNLKKRYKVERHRLQSHGIEASHWPWFKKMEQIVSNSAMAKSISDEDKSGSGSANILRQSNKRHIVPIPNPVGPTNNLKLKALANPRWRRVVFKISGSSLAGSGPQNIDPKVVLLIAKEVSIACHLGVEVAIVVGGGNFFCGDSWVATTGLDRSTAYQIGMMATVMNSMLLQSALEKLGVETRVQSTFPMQEATEPYSKRRAIRHLEKGRVVIFGGVSAGSGYPLFTTDTASALRASELNADAVLKGTNVDGIFDCNSRNDNSVVFEHLSFRELVSRGITPMDMMALTFCEENGIPVVVFNLLVLGNISRALCGQQVGTLIDQAGRSS